MTMKVEMISPAGRVVVPESDVDSKLAKGWTVVKKTTVDVKKTTKKKKSVAKAKS